MSHIRILMPSERDLLKAHLLRLDARSRRDRFSGYLNDAAVVRYCESVNWLESLAFGWFEDGELRAAVQLVSLGFGWPSEAELAVTVEPDWQDRGIGTALCRHALLAAQNRSISCVKMICLQENARMQRIVRKLRGRLLYIDGSSEGALWVPPPTYLSLWQEAFGEGGALMDTLVEQWRPTPQDEPRGKRSAGPRRRQPAKTSKAGAQCQAV